MAPSMNAFFFFFFFFSLSLLASVPFSSSLSFNFSSFGNDQPSTIELQGDAFFNRAIRLTKNEVGVPLTDSIGRAVYNEPLLLWDARTRELSDFTAHFSFVINSFNLSADGDGLAFFLSPYPSVIPANSAGGYLGLYGAGSSTANSTVAVEFDTFKNQWDDNDRHIGIDVNSINSSATVTWNSSIKDGRQANAWVSYNASTHNLSVFLTYKDNPVFSGNSSLHYIIDLREVLPEMVAVGFSAATGKAAEIHNLLSWSFSSTLQPRTKKKSKVAVFAVASVVGAIALITTAVGLLWFALLRKKATARNTEEDEGEDPAFDVTIDDEFERESGPKRFPYQVLASATGDFSEEGKLGEGGFGSVYKGYLQELELEVAIKRFSRGSKQGRKEYISEVKIISRLRHRNLVQLVGWCHDRGEFMLVYELMPNGSLDSYLYTAKKKTLGWPVRYKIALGLASALLYLHDEWEQCVVHRDVKPSNVMLDSSFNAKLGDFGLARLVDHDCGSQTTILAGTMGYLAPECVTTGKASKESDVYSFGIVALEIAGGRRPVEPLQQPRKVRLVEWVWELYGRGEILEAADEKLNGEFDEKQMKCLMVVGLWCAHPDHKLRPSIKQVISVLNFEAPLPELPATMPVPLYYAPPLDMCRFSYTSSVAASSGGAISTYSGYATNASTSCTSPTSSSTASRLLNVAKV